MAAYRMTPARRAALEKTQAASAAKRRLATRGRSSRLLNRKAVALVAIGGVVAHKIGQQLEENRFESENQKIIDRHTELARFHNARLNRLRSMVFPMQFPRDFGEQNARREAIDVLKRKKKRT